MKKILVRILAMMLVMMTMFSLAVPAMAETISQKSDADGDCKKTFYVKTDGYLLTKSVKMTMTKGNLAATYEGFTIDVGYNLPDSYEVTIWYWNASKSKWVKEDNYDIYCKSSYTIKFKKTNTYYKVLVDSYGAGTTVKSYVSHNKIQSSSVLNDMINGSKAYSYIWSLLPSWTIKDSAHCTLYKSNPVK